MEPTTVQCLQELDLAVEQYVDSAVRKDAIATRAAELLVEEYGPEMCIILVRALNRLLKEKDAP